MPSTRVQAPSATAAVGPHAAPADPLAHHAPQDPLEAKVAPDAGLPLVPLPSRFKPAAFVHASQARGIRPRALKVIDDHLEAVESTEDPIERFERLTALQRIVDNYVFRYGKDNTRSQATQELKRWLDGAVTLRAALYRSHKMPGPTNR